MRTLKIILIRAGLLLIIGLIAAIVAMWVYDMWIYDGIHINESATGSEWERELSK